MSGDDLEGLLEAVKNGSEWAHDMIVFRIERQANEITQLREQLAKAREELKFYKEDGR